MTRYPPCPLCVHGTGCTRCKSSDRSQLCTRAHSCPYGRMRAPLDPMYPPSAAHYLPLSLGVAPPLDVSRLSLPSPPLPYTNFVYLGQVWVKGHGALLGLRSRYNPEIFCCRLPLELFTCLPVYSSHLFVLGVATRVSVMPLE